MLKTISFGTVHMMVAFSVAYVMTGSVVVGGAIALVEPMINTVAYFFHEKFWDKRNLHASTKENFIPEMNLPGSI